MPIFKPHLPVSRVAPYDAAASSALSTSPYLSKKVSQISVPSKSLPQFGQYPCSLSDSAIFSSPCNIVFIHHVVFQHTINCPSDTRLIIYICQFVVSFQFLDNKFFCMVVKK